MQKVFIRTSNHKLLIIVYSKKNLTTMYSKFIKFYNNHLINDITHVFVLINSIIFLY